MLVAERGVEWKVEVLQECKCVGGLSPDIEDGKGDDILASRGRQYQRGRIEASVRQ